MFSYITKGTCSKEIQLQISNDTIQDVQFINGCDGNLQGISSLVKGMNIYDAMKKLEGIDCRGRGTSCPDQLAKAIASWISQNK